MKCYCEDHDHCYVEEFILERAACLPEQAENYYEIVKGKKDDPSKDKKGK